MMLATCARDSEALHAALVVVVALLTVVNGVVLWAWTRTIRSMREARDDWAAARHEYEDALATIRQRRRDDPSRQL